MSSPRTSHEDLVVFEANMDAAQRRYFQRTHAEVVAGGPMPFDELLAAEDDGEEGDVDDYEMRQRAMGARALLRFIKSAGVDMPSIMKQLFAVGRAVHDPYFSSLTMEESGLMYGNTKACHSWRCKILSGQLELAGMKGIQLPGQKNPEASRSYSIAQRGNKNRARNKPKQTQTSFTRKLQLNNIKQETPDE